MEMNEVDEKEIEEEIKAIIGSELSVISEIDLRDGLNLYGINSLTFVKIIVGIENRFNVTFDDDKLAISLYATLSDLVNYTMVLILSI